MTKAQIKFIQSLSRQKYRKEHNAYLVEGDKNAKEWLQSNHKIGYIAATAEWLKGHGALIGKHSEAEILTVAAFELEKITSMQHAQQVVLVAEKAAPVLFSQQADKWYLYLEKIQDPGNMGTIIRIADWFGIEQILCSGDCVEIYNPKVVQASMGSLLRVPVVEMDPEQFLMENKLPLYTASLSGKNIKEIKSHKHGVIAMGNESQGLSQKFTATADYNITIPRIGHAESLNVSVATGIICAELIL